MSYRVSTSDRDQKRIQEQNEKRLLALVKQNGNNVCCDCGATGPRWASFNIGCFLCIRCGGIHRRMGTHISKVKSISLDKWTPEQLQNMDDWGNLKVNALYLHNAGTRRVPSDDEGMEQYIRDKYERKRFLRPGARVASEVEASQASSRDSPIIDTALRSLHDMGFTDLAKNRTALTRTNGNVPAAIELVCREAELPQPAKVNTLDPRLTQLKAMGFEDMAANVAALRQAKGSVERAIELLVARDTQAPPTITSPKASAVLGITPQPVKNTSKSDDLFGDFTSAFAPEPKNNQVKDAFGDFVFPSTETPTALNTSNNTEATPNPTKGDKDYIMSLFSSVQPNSSTMPQFVAPGQQQFSNTSLNGLSFNNSTMSPAFGAPVQQQVSNHGFNGFGFTSGNIASSNASYGTPFTPSFSNPSSNQNPFQATPAANPVSQLDSAFASLDPFKLPGSNKAPPTSSNTSNNKSNGSMFSSASQTTSATNQADLLDLL